MKKNKKKHEKRSKKKKKLTASSCGLGGWSIGAVPESKDIGIVTVLQCFPVHL